MRDTVNLLEALQSSQPTNDRFYTVAIDGRSASGKSALAAHLRKLLPDFVVINGDDYFEPIRDEIVWGEFNEARFQGDVIEPLRRGSTFVYRPYDWHAEPHITETHVTITAGFCLERCFSFALGLDWDLKLWVETPAAVCLERGVARDSQHFPRQRALAAWRDVWQPIEDEYIRKHRPQEVADFVLDGTEPFQAQVT